MNFFVDIDIAKYTHYASILDSDGTVIEDTFPFDNNNNRSNYLLSKLSKYSLNDLVVSYESTSHYHLNLMNFLNAKGDKNILINPILTKRFRTINTCNVKNDNVEF